VCLAVPGKILDVSGSDPLMRTARVSFAGVVKDVNLAFVPEAGVGDYVIVHAGFALNKLDEGEAQEVLETLSQLELDEDARETP
jgi:hydrogenase expression/formation protein HypC